MISLLLFFSCFTILSINLYMKFISSMQSINHFMIRRCANIVCFEPTSCYSFKTHLHILESLFISLKNFSFQVIWDLTFTCPYKHDVPFIPSITSQTLNNFHLRMDSNTICDLLLYTNIVHYGPISPHDFKMHLYNLKSQISHF